MLCIVFVAQGWMNSVLAAPCVVLLHGLGRSPLSMQLLAWRLEAAGFAVRNLGYDSRTAPIASLADVVGRGIEACQRAGYSPVHFVTHSLGGILVRVYFQRGVPPGIGRVVMLAPPNHGSEIVDRHRNAAWFKWFTGPAGQELGTDADALPNRLNATALEVGVIAGTRSSDPWFSSATAGDGKVSVASTRLHEMRDFLTVPHGHTFMMNTRTVAEETIAFLRHGKFDHAKLP